MNAFRDGRVHVMDRQCDTCIFRPGNLMHLEKGRRAQMVREALANDAAIICHSTLGDGANAVCRGFFDAHDTRPLLLARALDAITYDDADGRHP